MRRRAACKILTALLTAWVAVLPARGAEGTPYDVFGRALAPIAAAVFGSPDGSNGAMVAECLVKNGTGPLAAAIGTRFRLAVQSPDRFRIDVVREGAAAPLTACRDGNQLWAVPAEPMTALAQAAGLDTTKTGPDTTSPPLIPLALNAQMLAFLPLVFEVKDLGLEDSPPRRRVLEFGLLPQLRETLQAADFTGRAWIGEDYRPSRLVIDSAGYSLELEIEKIEFADRLPDTAWQPAEGVETLRLPASALNELFEKMLSASAATAPTR
jgi:outer membrane lipoprotein-sorting protein